MVALSFPPPNSAVGRKAPGGPCREAGSEPRERVRDVLDELEEDVFAPLDVVEEADERLDEGTRFEQLAKRPGDLIRRGCGDVLIPEHDVECVLRGLVRERIGATELLQNLDDGPVRDALAVGETVTLHDSHVTERAKELVDEPCLSHACGAEDRKQVTGARAEDVVEGIVEQLELTCSSNHGYAGRTGGALGVCADREESRCSERLGLALQIQRHERLGHDEVTEKLKGRRSEQDLVGLRGLLQAGGDVDRVACREPFFGLR